MTQLYVVDASVVVDLLANFQSESIFEQIFNGRALLAAPELMDMEVLHTLRRLDADGRIPRHRTRTLLDDFRSLPIRRYRHELLWDDVWRRRRNLTAYDAAYVVLTKILGAVLVTRDQRLSRAPRLGVEVIVP